MEKSTKGWTLKELADLLEGAFEGPADHHIEGPAGVDGGGPTALAFAENDDYLRRALKSDVGAIIVTKDAKVTGKPLIRVDRPKEAFGRFLALCQNSMPIAVGIHPTAVISPDAVVDATASVGAYAVVESGVHIGAHCRIFPFTFVGTGCSIGDGSTLYPHSVLYSNVTLGSNTIVHSHAVVGCDGFGFTWNGENHVKVPHLGSTELGSNVEIGACTTVDRGMLGPTKIGDGCKIDNQVQIAHNVVMGKHVIVVSQTGISGSCEIGDRCTFAGQVGLGDHVKIGSDVTMTARAAVVSDLPEAGVYRGAPAIPIRDELKLEASLRKVPLLLKRVKQLEKEVEKLSGTSEA